MSRKRQVLELLSRDDLQGVARDYELDVADRRVKDELIEAIAHSKKGKVHEILESPSRNTPCGKHSTMEEGLLRTRESRERSEERD